MEVLNHDGLEIAHSLLEEDEVIEGGKITMTCNCSCEHIHPYRCTGAVMEFRRYEIDLTVGYCKQCRKFRRLVPSNQRLVLETNGCDLCKLAGCMH